jgi:exo-1,4-beta-D-glucosaminidase
VDIGSDGVKKVIEFKKPTNLGNIYFLKLDLKNASGETISSNFYWLSSKGDEEADFTDLNILAKVKIKHSITAVKHDGKRLTLTIELENPSSSLAFSVNPKIIKNKSKDLLLPVFWDDNYFSLLPKEKRTLDVRFNLNKLDGESPVLKIEGWNITPVMQEISGVGDR